MENNNEQAKSTKISMHSVKNLLGSQDQVSLFSDHDKEFANEFGIELFNSIDRFGVELSDVQLKVMEGILRGFSETGYKGNINPKEKNDFLVEKYTGKHPESYKYVREIPRLRASQSQILDWAGVNKNSIASKTRAIEALTDIGTTQYCFYYDRLAFSEEGQPEKDKDGKWKKEQVSTVDTLFTIKKVSEESSDNLSYYEITPSAIFLDQIDGYFILIPYKWREEVRKLFGNKKASAYTFRFLLFLRYQYELKRRRLSKNNTPHQIKWSAEEIAIAIKMPESVYIKKKKRMNEILEDAYSVAKLLGYLSEVDRQGHVDILTFNDQKYSLQQNTLPNGIQTEEGESEAAHIANNLLNLFVSCRKIVDPNYELPGDERCDHTKPFFSLLQEKNRDKEDIAKLIKWSQSQNYWATKMSTPAKFEKTYSEAWVECSLSKKQSKEDRFENNKTLAFEKLKHLNDKLEKRGSFNQPRLILLNKHVEISYGSQCSIVEYSDSQFCEKLNEALAKFQFQGVSI